jgi:streptomycin 6-kinase
MHNDIFAHTITKVYGSKGTAWLAQLSALIAQCAQEWQLTELRPFPNLTYNYVLSGYSHQTPIVLKLRCNNNELDKEIAALSAYADYGGVKMIAHNRSLGALLLERVVPGGPLSMRFPRHDRSATHIAAHLLKKLHQVPIPQNHTFSSLRNILPDFTQNPPALAPFLSHARTLKEKLLSSPSHPVLLHGDFHHDNILLNANNEWTVIDPEGIIGDSLYDIALFIRNPLAQLINAPDIKNIIHNRMSDFASLLNYSPCAIYDWTYVQTVTSAYWSIEDGLEATNHCAFLTILQTMQSTL